MRKTLLFILLLIGIVALFGQPVLAGTSYTLETSATPYNKNVENVIKDEGGYVKAAREFVGRNQDNIENEWVRGHDYTYYFTEMGYSSWTSDTSATPIWTKTSMWGGWFWASQFVAPCPQWQKELNGVPDHYQGTCDWNPKVADDYHMSDNPQTAWGPDTSLDGTILDDLYARVVDNWEVTYDPPLGVETWKGILDQDIDILFSRYSGAVIGSTAAGGGPVKEKFAFENPAEPGEYFVSETMVDQALDQVLAYWNDTMGSIANELEPATENGITQRLVSEFGLLLFASLEATDAAAPDGVVLTARGEMDNNLANGDETIYLHKEHGLDQWVTQWLRDIVTAPELAGGGKKGIDQYFSSHFGDEADFEPPCVKCGYTYELGHASKSIKVNKDTSHDHTPDETNNNGSSGDTMVWDP